jgi:K+-transporting ATPase ATPase C chain
VRRDLLTSVIAIVLFTVLLGVGYPLVVTGISQVAFPHQAAGSRILRDGRLVGSSLIGQDFSRPVLGPGGKPKLDGAGKPVLAPDPHYFQSRPSSTGYSASATAFSNAGPNSKDLHARLVAARTAYLALERPYNAGLRAGDVPNDAVQTSASNVDPHISVRNARIQAARVAAVRHLSRAHVLSLVSAHTDTRALGFLGEPGVNVLQLNLALDQGAGR